MATVRETIRRSVRLRRAGVLLLTVATAFTLVGLAAGCGSGGSTEGLTGVHWVLTSVRRDGATTDIPRAVDAWIAFGPGDQVSLRDGVNFGNGRYRRTSAGITTFEVASTLMGYSGTDPGHVMAQAAMNAVTDGSSTSAVTLAGSNLTLSVGGYELHFIDGGTGTPASAGAGS